MGNILIWANIKQVKSDRSNVLTIGLKRKYCVCEGCSYLPDIQLSSFSIMDVCITASHEKPV